MKLSQLFETIETRPAAEVWAEISSKASSYTPSMVYLVKPSETARDEFLVYTDEKNKRQLYATMSSDDLKDSLKLIRVTDKPDAEGFMMYRSRETLEAAKYIGDPVNVSNDFGDVMRLSSGDFLVRSTDKDEYTFSVESKSFFDDGYTKV